MTSTINRSIDYEICVNCNVRCDLSFAKYFQDIDRFLCRECTLKAVAKIANNNGHTTVRAVPIPDDGSTSIIPCDLRCTMCDARYSIGVVDGRLLTDKCHVPQRPSTRTHCPSCGFKL